MLILSNMRRAGPCQRLRRARPYNARVTRIHRRMIARAFDGIFSSAFALGRLHPNARPGKHGVERLRDVPYLGSGRPEHRLDVWRPAHRSGLLPAILYVHGGAFQALSRDSHWLHALALARHGFVVFNVDYRLAPAFRFPAGLQDVCAAALWVQGNAAAWGGDAARLCFAGDSAGANLAAALALCAAIRRTEPWARAVFDADLRPRVVSGAYGVYQISGSARFLRRPGVGWATGQRILDVEDCYLPLDGSRADLADPLVLLEHGDAPERPLPAFFLAAGEADPVLDDTLRLGAALRAIGVDHELRTWPGEPHGFDALIWRRAALDCWAARYEFLDRHLASAG